MRRNKGRIAEGGAEYAMIAAASIGEAGMTLGIGWYLAEMDLNWAASWPPQ